MTQQKNDGFKEAALSLEGLWRFSAKQSEIILRTAEIALQMGAKQVSIQASFFETHFDPSIWGARLIVENSAGDELFFSVTPQGYALAASAFGEWEHEEVLLYLRALGAIQLHCEAPVTTIR